MACGGKCMTTIVCGALASAASWLVTHALDRSEVRRPTFLPRVSAPFTPPTFPPRPRMVCDKWTECRKVSTGPCVHISRATVRCPWRRECRVVRRCR
jgi:hypothetical protein